MSDSTLLPRFLQGAGSGFGESTGPVHASRHEGAEPMGSVLMGVCGVMGQCLG